MSKLSRCCKGLASVAENGNCSGRSASARKSCGCANPKHYAGRTGLPGSRAHNTMGLHDHVHGSICMDRPMEGQRHLRKAPSGLLSAYGCCSSQSNQQQLWRAAAFLFQLYGLAVVGLLRAAQRSRQDLCTCDCEEGAYAHSGGAYFGGPEPLLPGVAVLLGISRLSWQEHLNSAIAAAMTRRGKRYIMKVTSPE